jgi:hypothetical protein
MGKKSAPQGKFFTCDSKPYPRGDARRRLAILRNVPVSMSLGGRFFTKNSPFRLRVEKVGQILHSSSIRSWWDWQPALEYLSA